MMHGDASLVGIFPTGTGETNRRQEVRWRLQSSFPGPPSCSITGTRLKGMLPLGHPPPPPDQKALPGGVPEDLSEDNLSTWADTVQDVAVGMIVPQPGDGSDNIPPVSGASDSPGVGVTGGILSPVLPAGLHLQMP